MRRMNWLMLVGMAVFLAEIAPVAVSAQSANIPPKPALRPLPPPPPRTPPRADLWNKQVAMMQQQNNAARYVYDHTLTFVECVQRLSMPRVAKLLVQPQGSKKEARAIRSMLRWAPGCGERDLVVSHQFIRGAAAEVMLRNLQLQEPETARRLNSVRVGRFLDATPDGGDDVDDDVKRIIRFTQCQVSIAPGLTRRMLEARVGSAESERWRKMIADATRQCGTAETDEDFARLLYRSYLAEAFYHWTRTGDIGPAS